MGTDGPNFTDENDDDEDARRIIEQCERRGMFREVNGMWYFDSSAGGGRLFLTYALRVIADEIERRNATRKA